MDDPALPGKLYFLWFLPQPYYFTDRRSLLLSVLPMFSFLSIVSLAQISPSLPPQPVPPPQEVIQVQEVRPLPGQLDTTPVFNSNSPELVETEGILLSTFPPEGKRVPSAHLNFPLQKRFDLFAHHISRAHQPDDFRTLYMGVVVHNPGQDVVTLDVLQAASYLSRPDAPFIDLPPYVANPLGNVFSGPGSRVVNAILRGQRQDNWLAQLVIPPGESRMLLNLPIPARDVPPRAQGGGSRNGGSPGRSVASTSQRPLQPSRSGTGTSPSPRRDASGSESAPSRPLPPSSNGRSTLMHLMSSGPVYLASLAMFGRPAIDGPDRPPTLDEWKILLENGDLAGPRDLAPTSLEKSVGRVIYGRVAGVAKGAQWRTQIKDHAKARYLSIPERGKIISYALSTVSFGTLGTGQVQSAPMLARYPDTAYLAHGNYGIHYSLSLPLHNYTSEPQTVTLAMQTPLKDEQVRGALKFLVPPDRQVFFRGTIRLRYNDDNGIPQTRYFHLVQRRGQMGEPLIRLNMPADDRRLVEVDFIYPPDSTPPQVLTIQTLESPAPSTVRAR